MPFTQSAVQFDLQCRQLPSFRCSKFKRRQVFVGLIPLGSVSTTCFTDSNKMRMTSSLRFPLRHELYSVVSLAIGVSTELLCSGVLFFHLKIVKINRHAQDAGLLHQAVVLHTRRNEEAHNWDITITNGPRHTGNQSFSNVSWKW